MAELKPCPFCGVPPKIHEANVANIDWWVVYCKNKVCEVRPMTHYRRLRREAIEAWNRRYTPSEIDFDYDAED